MRSLTSSIQSFLGIDSEQNLTLKAVRLRNHHFINSLIVSSRS